MPEIASRRDTPRHCYDAKAPEVYPPPPALRPCTNYTINFKSVLPEIRDGRGFKPKFRFRACTGEYLHSSLSHPLPETNSGLQISELNFTRVDLDSRLVRYKIPQFHSPATRTTVGDTALACEMHRCKRLSRPLPSPFRPPPDAVPRMLGVRVGSLAFELTSVRDDNEATATYYEWYPCRTLEYLENNNTRDSKSSSFSVPISGGEDFYGKSEEHLWMHKEPFVVAKSRHYGHLKGNEGIYLFYCLQRGDASVYTRACARVSVEALLPCKGGTRFDCPVFVKWRPLERASFSIFALFVKRRGGCARMQNGRDDPSNALFYRRRYSC